MPFYIPLPNSLHCEWTVKAAQAGKHILCEKPIALTVTEVDEMTQAATDNNVALLEASAYQMHPQLAKLKEVIKEGLIGPLKLIRATFSFTLRDLTNIRMNKTLGGGSLWDVGGYPVSLAQTIVEANPIEVFAWQTLNSSGVDVALVGQLKFANWVIAQIDCGYNTPYRIGAEIVGSKGSIQLVNPWQPDVDGRPSGLIHITPDNNKTDIPTDVIDPYLCQIQAMEQAVLDGQPTPYTLSQSRNNIATINALYQSAKTGKIVSLKTSEVSLSEAV